MTFHPGPSSIVVLEEPNPRYVTGLLDPSGNPIYRTQHKNPIGFVWYYDNDETGIEVHN